MTAHKDMKIRTNKGLRLVSIAQLTSLVDDGRVRQDHRVITQDDGRSWITVETAFASVPQPITGPADVEARAVPGKGSAPDHPTGDEGTGPANRLAGILATGGSLVVSVVLIGWFIWSQAASISHDEGAPERARQAAEEAEVRRHAEDQSRATAERTAQEAAAATHRQAEVDRLAAEQAARLAAEQAQRQAEEHRVAESAAQAARDQAAAEQQRRQHLADAATRPATVALWNDFSDFACNMRLTLYGVHPTRIVKTTAELRRLERVASVFDLPPDADPESRAAIKEALDWSILMLEEVQKVATQMEDIDGKRKTGALLGALAAGLAGSRPRPYGSAPIPTTEMMDMGADGMSAWSQQDLDPVNKEFEAVTAMLVKRGLRIQNRLNAAHLAVEQRFDVKLSQSIQLDPRKPSSASETSTPAPADQPLAAPAASASDREHGK